MDMYICRTTLENNLTLSYKIEYSHSKSMPRCIPKRNSFKFTLRDIDKYNHGNDLHNSKTMETIKLSIDGIMVK